MLGVDRFFVRLVLQLHDKNKKKFSLAAIFDLL
ncbi:hypothetical protein HCH_04778 [Hahella chejuensis KCTC 2396]|uniref:Uncharacterized protein n=1 Tax=Hahella chejuensis (strain KCTC 2396) TaxID=349521 RepID=Q2SD02_HAHCH|nr:hypothetical protein HCH_04778 [Hahella chejuensis KCTC 2396]